MYLSVAETASLSPATDRTFDIDHLLLLQNWQKKSQSIVDKMEPFSKPHENSPFVFFHNRKCGGTSIRKIIFEACKKANISKCWIPCYEPKKCVPYSLPPLLNQEVYASHLNYGALMHTMRENKIPTYSKFVNNSLDNGELIKINLLDDDDGFGSCITNLRSTVSRVVSCWNFRMRQNRAAGFRLPQANELSALDWANLLPKSYSDYSEGCNNEIFRTMGSSIDETYINTMTTYHPSFSYEFNKTAKHLSKCIIIMNERCEDSNKILSHFIPWLGKVDICSEKINSSTLKAKDKTSLAANASQVILENNQIDELLYQFGQSLFEQQLKAAT